MSKLCINKCIPYVQKYDWGEEKNGLVCIVMKNIVKDNYEIIKKEIGNLDYLQEYIDSDDSRKNDVKNVNDIQDEEVNSEKEAPTKEPHERYAELWIGNHSKGPNLVVHNNKLVKMENFLNIYEKKKNKKINFFNYIYKKLQTTKQKYFINNNTLKPKNMNSFNDNNENNKNSHTQITPSNNHSLKKQNDLNVLLKQNALLPYLFKVLSISKPLSIQIHPNQEQSLYLNSVNPFLYKDKLLKTEMCVCINSMKLLCGFMNIFKISFLINNINELKQIFLKDEININGDKDPSLVYEQSEETSNRKRTDNSIYQDGINKEELDNEKENDVFFLYELFTSKKKKHIEEVLTTLSRIYIYIICYVIKTENNLNYDIVSVIDKYAKLIQRYIFDKNFFFSFYKNENFLQETFNLSNLIITEKEKLKKSLKKNKANHSNMGEYVVRNKDETTQKEEGQNKKCIYENLENPNIFGVDAKSEQRENQLGKSREDGIGEGKENEVEKNAYNDVLSKERRNEKAGDFFSRKKTIKKLYEEMYKFFIYRNVFEDNNVVIDCINSIKKNNEEYVSLINSEETLITKIKKLYEGISLKKNYEVLCKEVESIIIHNVFETLETVSKHYMNDKGILFVFILQLIKLNDGDVIYIKPGVIHSYLSGNCLECMTNSDLVIRAGLTKKNVDELNFIKYVNYENNYPIILEKEYINYNIISYAYHEMKHFKILYITINPGEQIFHLFSEVSFTSCIVLSTNKKVKIIGKKYNKKKISITNVKNCSTFLIAPKITVRISNFYSCADDGNKEFVMYCATS